MSYKRKEHNARKRWRNEDWNHWANTREYCVMTGKDGRQKTKYQTFDDAEYAKYEQESKSLVVLRIYSCPVCHTWHLTQNL